MQFDSFSSINLMIFTSLHEQEITRFLMYLFNHTYDNTVLQSLYQYVSSIEKNSIKNIFLSKNNIK